MVLKFTTVRDIFMYRINIKCLFYTWERRRCNERPWSPRPESCWCPAKGAKLQDRQPWVPKTSPPSLELMPCGGKRDGEQTGENMVDFKVIKEKAGKSEKQGE